MSETPKPQTQGDKFRGLARELECDEDEARFGKRLNADAKLSPAKEGYWRVEHAKMGRIGQRAVFHPATADTWAPGPTFPTPQEVYRWLRDQGCQQDRLDPDIWWD